VPAGVSSLQEGWWCRRRGKEQTYLAGYVIGALTDKTPGYLKGKTESTESKESRKWFCSLEEGSRRKLKYSPMSWQELPRGFLPDVCLNLVSVDLLIAQFHHECTAWIAIS
jgi:hypothetical protein